MFDKIKDVVSDITGGKDLGDLDLGGYEKYLDGVTWPITKEELIGAVTRNGGGSEIAGLIGGLTGDKFNGPEDILGALAGGLTGGADAGKQAADDAGEGLKDLKNSI